ncbi:EscR/YscR/HrcR family type III secretion system export apparatus protein [Exilibacterium tricleocarpae]|uniref:EscR/YscR/HrcR family type III secretion system export apparatus protein n=1 Tax=Exilibacterium tricleocarpae TaxID=2591008 RepID=A0A545U3U2_9GAMM|nr:type III secretion system export apparatus subunit SctR [Exilibacterium tricleocarpae]TQV84083.1 EscR/YscR/HrcR family type III secretion system export apparatus protein [Exilibacterium tricleocarpae]
MTGEGFEPYPLILLLASLSILPFLLVVTTSFLKISMVLMIVRNAMGIQQVPPNMVLYGISLAVTLFVMAPTIQQVNTKVDDLSLEDQSITSMLDSVGELSEPIRDFMLKQNHPDVQIMMMETAKELWPEEMYETITKENFLLLVPSFVVSELQTALQIGFLIYVPFIIVDLLVSNILLALGMQMVSPMTVSLPLKILLFVLVEGWAKLLQSLALSYV